MDEKRDDVGNIWIVFIGSGLSFLSIFGLYLFILLKEKKNFLKAPAFL
jgi:hypothetical protein